MANIMQICGSIYQELIPVLPEPLSVAELNAYCTFKLLITITAVAGNILVLIVIGKFRILRKQSNVYLVSLALADILVAITVKPLEIYESWNLEWGLSKRACYLRNVFDGSLNGVSILSLCCLALDRYLAVYHPLVMMKITQPMVGAVVAFCWILPLLVWTVLFLTGWHLTGFENFEFCLMLVGSCVYIRNTANICSVIILSFILPSAFVTFVYLKIFLTARKQARAIRDTNPTSEDRKRISTLTESTKSAVILCIIVVLFLICWMPFYFTLTADVVNDYLLVHKKLLDALLWLGYLNSMMNPVVYCIFSQDFSFAFKQLFLCKGTQTNM